MNAMNGEQKARAEVVKDMSDWVYEKLANLSYDLAGSSDAEEKKYLDEKRKAFWYVIDHLYILSSEFDA